MRNNQKISLGFYIPEARHVFMRQEKPRQKLVVNTKKFFYPF